MKINRLLSPKQLVSKVKHTLLAGLPGMGKGMAGESYVTQFVGEEKVFDLHSESRGEGMYYGLPQTDSGLLFRINYLTNGRLVRYNDKDNPKSKHIKNEIIMLRGKNLNKLTRLPKNIKVCMFNEEWVSNEDLKHFLAFNENQSGFLDMIFELVEDRHLNLSQLYKFLDTASKNKLSKPAKLLKQMGAHYMSINTIKRRARTLLRSGIFFNSLEEETDDIDNNNFYFLDLPKSLQEIDAITSFSTYLIEDEYIKYVAEAVLLKKFIELIETRQYDVPITFYIREANDFYYMGRNSPPYVVDIQESIEKILRKGRFLGGAKVTVIMDTQLLNDILRSVFNNFNKFICFRLPITDSKLLETKATIPTEYLYKLASCDVGQGMYVVNGGFEYLCLFIPTLHQKADPEFDVFRYLANIYGIKDYATTNFIKNIVEQEQQSLKIEGILA